ncbi:MAG: hypothetical protein CMJ94_03635 [Planctomycetes bacterium]|nr:hypothetical protein [Planctomycetota bacterium]
MLTVLVWSVTGPGASPAARTDAGGEEAIVLELQRLRASVEALDRVAPGAAAAAPHAALPGAAASGGRQVDLEPVLRDLQQAIAGLADQVESGGQGVAGLKRARSMRQTANWAELQPLAELMSRDDEAADRQVRLLTPPELLARFGPPDHVWSGGDSGAVTWHYERIGMVEGEEVRLAEINLRVQNGYVIESWGEDRATEQELSALEDRR